MIDDKTFIVGGAACCFRVCLSISGEDLDPDELTGWLGQRPDVAHRRGEPSTKAAVHTEGLWSIEKVGGAEDQVEGLLTELVGRVKATPETWSKVSGRYRVSADVGVFVAGGNRDLTLSPRLVQRIASLGASLWIDMYCTGGDAGADPSIDNPA
jgi:hypothetical protein